MGKRTFSKEYKLQTSMQIKEEGKWIKAVSQTLGIAEQSIYHWLREFDKDGEKAFKASELSPIGCPVFKLE